MRRMLIVGSGHMAERLCRLAVSAGDLPVRLRSEGELPCQESRSRFEYLIEALREATRDGLDCAFLADEHEASNLELLLALRAIDGRLRVVLTSYDERLGLQLKAADQALEVVNPARVAAPQILAVLEAPAPSSPARMPTIRSPRRAQRMDPLLVRLGVAFAILLTGATWYFHDAERLSWIDTIYFVTVTIATVGYGDISLAGSSTASKLVGIGFILASMGLVWVIFSLTMDHLIKRRVQTALGRRRSTLREHVIVCGVGRAGERLVEGLLERGEQVVLVEFDGEAPGVYRWRGSAVHVYVGDAKNPDVLEDVGICHAKALFAVTNNDHTNVAIGLNAMSRGVNLRLAIRVFDDAMAVTLRERFGMWYTYSVTALSSEAVYKAWERADVDARGVANYADQP